MNYTTLKPRITKKLLMFFLILAVTPVSIQAKNSVSAWFKNTFDPKKSVPSCHSTSDCNGRGACINGTCWGGH